VTDRYKCFPCRIVICELSDKGTCPECDSAVVPMCERDHTHCSHDISAGIAYCPLCGEAVCPQCGSHDVAQVSRVTGYLGDVAGWNNAKKQELKDRTRYLIDGSIVPVPEAS
jgi:hypothetical protein